MCLSWYKNPVFHLSSLIIMHIWASYESYIFYEISQALSYRTSNAFAHSVLFCHFSRLPASTLDHTHLSLKSPLCLQRESPWGLIYMSVWAGSILLKQGGPLLTISLFTFSIKFLLHSKLSSVFYIGPVKLLICTWIYSLPMIMNNGKSYVASPFRKSGLVFVSMTNHTHMSTHT